MKVVAIVQARMGSTRLPGKVLREIQGRPMIDHVLERASRIEDVDAVCVATSRNRQDDRLVDHVKQSGLASFFRGSEEDVLSRFVGAAGSMGAEVVVRVTADCPLLSPAVSSTVVRELLDHAGECDYASNTLERTFPRGLDTEVFTIDALLTADAAASDPWDREHVTPYIYKEGSGFKLRGVRDEKDRSRHRWTVDTPEDLDLVTRIYGELWRPDCPVFEYEEVLKCLEEHPAWVRINYGVEQKER